MLDSLFDIINRLNVAQRGTKFRIVATILGFALLSGIIVLARSDYAAYLPPSFRNDLLTSSIGSAIGIFAVVWLNQTLTALIFLCVGIPLSRLLMFYDQPEWSRVTVGVLTLSIIFFAVLQAVRILLSYPSHPMAVARLVLDEAVRMKMAILFIIGLLILIPLLAMTLDPTDALRYRIQTFLSYGTGVSYGMLALMTLFLATASTAFEQRDKQIFQVMTKPVSRAGYLFGKWLGIMALNAILLAIVAGSVFWYTQYLRTLQPLDMYDRLAVDEQVLTARVGVKPTLEDPTVEVQEKAIEIIQNSPEMDMDGTTIQRIGQAVFDEVRARQLMVLPGNFKEFTFHNVKPISKTTKLYADFDQPILLPETVKTRLDVIMLNDDGKVRYAEGEHFVLQRSSDEVNGFDTIHLIRGDSETNQNAVRIHPGQPLSIRYYPANALTLRFKISSGDEDPVVHFPLSIGVVGTDFFEVHEVALIQTQTMLIPAGTVDENGDITLMIGNGNLQTRMPGPDVISFPPDGLEMMYKVSNFESNYLRGICIIWLKLGFLAALGIAAATFTSFPVACLIAFCIFLGAESGPFLGESIDSYQVRDIQTRDIIYIKWIIAEIATAVHWALIAYGDIRPSANLVEGRLVSWMDVWRTFSVITIIWTGLTGVIGWLIFRARQLAIYSGNT